MKTTPKDTKHALVEPSGTQNVISSESKWLHHTARVLAGIVAVGSAVLSFDALTQLAIAAGISPRFGWLWAVVVDGFILIATISVFALRKRGARALAWPFTILGLFVLISIIGNGIHPILLADELQLAGTPVLADGGKLPFWAAVAVGAVPPVALFLAIHLIIIMITPSKTQEELMEKEAKAEARKAAKAPAAPRQVAVPTPAAVRAPQPVFTPVATPAAVFAAANTKPTSVTAPAPEPENDVEEPEQVEPENSFGLPAFPQITPEITETTSTTVIDGDMTLEDQMRERLQNGENITGKEAAEFFGVTIRTGQKKLRKLREELGLV